MNREKEIGGIHQSKFNLIKRRLYKRYELEKKRSPSRETLFCSVYIPTLNVLRTEDITPFSSPSTIVETPIPQVVTRHFTKNTPSRFLRRSPSICCYTINRMFIISLFRRVSYVHRSSLTRFPSCQP